MEESLIMYTVKLFGLMTFLSISRTHWLVCWSRRFCKRFFLSISLSMFICRFRKTFWQPVP